MIDTAFSRSVGSRSHDLLGECLIIMRNSLVVADAKHCSVVSESGGSGKTHILSPMTTFYRMRAILYVKYFEEELHNVSSEECSGSAFNFCQCRIVFTDFQVMIILNNIN